MTPEQIAIANLRARGEHDAAALIDRLSAELAEARREALKEAAAKAWSVEGGDRWTRGAAQDAILALIEKEPTNE